MKCKNCENNALIYGSDEQFRFCDATLDSKDENEERECSHFKRRSNADRIRNMTDDEMAEFLCMKINGCNKCEMGGFCLSHKIYYLRWLWEEVEE